MWTISRSFIPYGSPASRLDCKGCGSALRLHRT